VSSGARAAASEMPAALPSRTRYATWPASRCEGGVRALVRMSGAHRSRRQSAVRSGYPGSLARHRLTWMPRPMHPRLLVRGVAAERTRALPMRGFQPSLRVRVSGAGAWLADAGAQEGGEDSLDKLNYLTYHRHPHTRVSCIQPAIRSPGHTCITFTQHVCLGSYIFEKQNGSS
jgi:hypothetical protein